MKVIICVLALAFAAVNASVIPSYGGYGGYGTVLHSAPVVHAAPTIVHHVQPVVRVVSPVSYGAYGGYGGYGGYGSFGGLGHGFVAPAYTRVVKVHSAVPAYGGWIKKQ